MQVYFENKRGHATSFMIGIPDGDNILINKPIRQITWTANGLMHKIEQLDDYNLSYHITKDDFTIFFTSIETGGEDYFEVFRYLILDVKLEWLEHKRRQKMALIDTLHRVPELFKEDLFNSKNGEIGKKIISFAKLRGGAKLF
jgi:hypothetical protein